MAQNETMLERAKKSSRIARRSAARLAAVQAVYQMMGNEQTASSVVADFMDKRLGADVEGHEMVVPDGAFFQSIVFGISESKKDLNELLVSAAKDRGMASFDPLLRSILLCGAFELLANTDVDAPVIISDYLHVTHAFFEGGEEKLVNGILDRIKIMVRDA